MNEEAEKAARLQRAKAAQIGVGMVGLVTAAFGMGLAFPKNVTAGAILTFLGFTAVLFVTAFKWTPKLPRNTDAVSPVIAVILMVAITVVLAATVFVLVSDIGTPDELTPSVNFAKDTAEGNLTVISVSDSGIQWSTFDVQGCTGVPTGTVTAGDTITGCSGKVFIRHVPSESLVYQTEFAA